MSLRLGDYKGDSRQRVECIWTVQLLGRVEWFDGGQMFLKRRGD